MYVNLSLNSIEWEAANKISSMLECSERSEQDLLQLCAQRFEKSDIEYVHRALAFARSLTSSNPSHPSMQIYLSHPIRVARIALQLQTSPSARTVALGLLHNVFEVTGIGDDELINAGYDVRMANGIRLLTIDREQQYEAGYLADFYRKIEEFGEELVLIKSVDRLDNLLAFQLIERTPRIERYIELSDQFVTPMSARLSPELGKYHSDVIQYVREVGCDAELKSKYDAFIANAAHG